MTETPMALTEEARTLIAIETVLARLRSLAQADRFVVRGSFVSRYWSGPQPRACKDLDLLYLGDYAPDYFTMLMGRLMTQADASPCCFNSDTLLAHPIWQDSISPGIRFTCEYAVYGVEGALQVDIAVGDPLTIPPRIVEIPSVLNRGAMIAVPAVAVEIAAAWKLHGLFEHMHGGWMSKTLWDLYLFCKHNSLDPIRLREAIHVAFESRMDPLAILRRLLYGDFGRSKKSRRSWRSLMAEYPNQRIEPMELVLDWLQTYLDPVLQLKNDGTLLTQSEVITYRVKLLKEDGSEAARKKLRTLQQKRKLLPYKAYTSIPHLPGSRTGLADKHIDVNKADMLTSRQRYPDDVVIVQEKLDGSCVAALRTDDRVLALGRDGDLADESPNPARRLWAEWVEEHQARFLDVLEPGERLVGEWLALVHGTRYRLMHEPFVPFDIFTADNQRLTHAEFLRRVTRAGFTPAHTLHVGEPCSIDEALRLLGDGAHGCVDAPEGAVWRLERGEQVLFLGKFVRHGKTDGAYLPENSGCPALWNWHPYLPAFYEEGVQETASKTENGETD
ncbi:nucleotidyl transferase AbiEii/AbiGii toxin family protein [Hahella aquimaris]|uniref:nucleotidyl transferase AbiEii/AbiGii toxin family protein n=1 Tax=Hahella sp. HNIBRBA332 TaxID=3015983 RepID=UPI00273AA748|nr:nucleotidyl transferase AbiEii/AbiGii toxin family protein [Hahella sp. HNIBRBA332]WLQ17197.1 nucleotidyl transferase AbiEii/AbiGii toxin family protein [Hahella sp. HNIBRBA332]